MVCLVKRLGAANRKISAKKNRPKTTTAPCQKLIASTSLEIAIEFVAMYFLLLLVESAYEQPRKLSLSAPAKIDFLSFLNQRAASLPVSIDAYHIDIDAFFWTSVIQKGTIVSSWTRTRETRFTVGWYWGRPFRRPRNIFMRDLRRRESTIPTSGYLKHSSTKGLCR